jgi:hypothetical protein
MRATAGTAKPVLTGPLRTRCLGTGRAGASPARTIQTGLEPVDQVFSAVLSAIVTRDWKFVVAQSRHSAGSEADKLDEGPVALAPS